MSETLSGIVHSSLTYSAGTTVTLTADVQIASGVTIHLEAGATLDLAGFEILNFGQVTLSGNSTDFAIMRNGTYSTDDAAGNLVSDYGRLDSVVSDPFSNRGSLTLSNTLVQNSQIEALDTNTISDSAFVDSTFDLGTEGATVTDSTFVNSQVSLLAWNSYFSDSSTFTRVNFVHDSTAIYLDPFFSSDSGRQHKISIVDSYINTDDPDSKIYDADDDLRVITNISSDSFVSQPITNNAQGFSVGSYQIDLLDAEETLAEIVTVESELSVLVDEGVLGDLPTLLKNLTETRVYEGDTLVSHSLNYNGTDFEYGNVGSMITTVTRDGSFTTEFQQEIADFIPSASSITYSDAITLLGVSGVDAAILTIAGADGNFVS